MSSSKEKINKIIEYLNNGKYSNAENIALSNLKQNPNDPTTLGILGGIYLAKKIKSRH